MYPILAVRYIVQPRLGQLLANVKPKLHIERNELIFIEPVDSRGRLGVAVLGTKVRTVKINDTKFESLCLE